MESETSNLLENECKRQVKLSELNKIKKKMEVIKEEASAQINEHLQKFISELVQELEGNKELSSEMHNLYSNNTDDMQDKTKSNGGDLLDKHYVTRNSLLTDMYENKHIKTIYHIFLALLFGLFINSTVHDIIHKRQTNMGINLVLCGYANIHILIYLWICIFICSLPVYTGLHFWASVRIQLFPKSLKLKVWDNFCLALFIIYMPAFVILSTKYVVNYKLSEIESITALCEITRLMMKIYAFVRSNVPKILKYKQHTEQNEVVPEFSKFLYFWFAPTLVYKDHYPRTKCIRWRFVVVCFLEVIGCLLYISFIFDRFLVTDFADYGLRHYSWQEITLIILGNAMVGILVLLCGFYAVLHSWMNGFAELLKFGDRLFYKDWWTSAYYGRFYRTWNVIVHDWLHTYIYKDMYEIVFPKNKFISKFFVFLISATFHEYILGFTFRFFYPILFIEFFGLGLLFSFLKINYNLLGNLCVWYSLALGMGIAVSVYCMEIYARLNCPIENPTLFNYIIPRSFTCNVH